MCSDNMPEVLIKVFAQLLQYWEAEAAPEEIGSDVTKIDLMNQVNYILKNSTVVIPRRVTQLYAKVYLRDVWS